MLTSVENYRPRYPILDTRYPVFFSFYRLKRMNGTGRDRVVSDKPSIASRVPLSRRPLPHARPPPFILNPQICETRNQRTIEAKQICPPNMDRRGLLCTLLASGASTGLAFAPPGEARGGGGGHGGGGHGRSGGSRGGGGHGSSIGGGLGLSKSGGGYTGGLHGGGGGHVTGGGSLSSASSPSHLNSISSGGSAGSGGPSSASAGGASRVPAPASAGGAPGSGSSAASGAGGPGRGKGIGTVGKWDKYRKAAVTELPGVKAGGANSTSMVGGGSSTSTAELLSHPTTTQHYGTFQYNRGISSPSYR